LHLNKKERNKMNAIKGATVNSRVIIQEGVVTNVFFNKNSAEILLYLINSKVIGNLLRVNSAIDNLGNLNGANSSFVNLDNFSSNFLQNFQPVNNIADDLKIYQFIASLSWLACEMEASFYLFKK